MEINKKVLASVFIISMLAFSLGYGTYSYFSDTEESTDNVFTAGTLNIEIVEGIITSPPNWAPGESFTVTFKIENTGTIDIKYLGIDLHNYDFDDDDLADVIQVIGFRECIPGYGWIDNLGAEQHYQTLVGDGDDVLTLKELMQSYIVGVEPLESGGFEDEFGNHVNHLMDCVTGSGYDITPGPAIKAGGVYKLELTFKFMETAGDEYQGDECSLDIAFMAVQDLSQLDEYTP